MANVFIPIIALAIGVGALLFSRSANARETLEPIIVNNKRRNSFDRVDVRKINNPTHLEYHNIGWLGEIGTDGRYSVFDTAVNGIRAGMINLHTMMTRDGRNTVRRIISAWAPAHENPTEAYVSFIANRLHVSPDQPLRAWRDIVLPMTQGIVAFENGYDPYPDSIYQEALQATGKV